MMVVIDTNVLVSALLSRDGTPAKVIGMVLNGTITLCYDYRIICEYRDVLKRPKFGFSNGEINSLIDWFESNGQSVIAEPVNKKFDDEEDKKFYEVAKHCNAILVTGNLKHFPKESWIMNPMDFLKKYSL